MKDHMRIVQLQAENFKRIRAIEITPTGDIVTIAGRNAQGKTSIIDAIWAALAGADHIQSKPIRAGERYARIRLDLGEIKVERRFTEKNTTLIVENADGARFPSPQKMLDSLIGALSFDPLAFVRSKPADQISSLKSIAGITIDFDKLTAANKADYERRTEVNRKAKQKRDTAAAIQMPAVAAEPPTEEIDEAALLDQLERAAEHNEMVASRTAARRELRIAADKLRHEAETHRSKAAADRTAAATLIAQAEESEMLAASKVKMAEEKDTVIANGTMLPEPLDVSAIRQQLDAAKQANAGRAQLQLATGQRDGFIEQAKVLEQESDAITAAMEAREKQKADAIAAAKMPVAGLAFGDGILTFNGVPIDQASSADQLKISLCIAMAANPKLRVIRIQDGSLLDSVSLAFIADMASAGDYQIWIEKVDETGKIGITIEDGAVIAVNEDPPPAA